MFGPIWDQWGQLRGGTPGLGGLGLRAYDLKGGMASGDRHSQKGGDLEGAMINQYMGVAIAICYPGGISWSN